jgi:outer membrane protein TolC
VGALPDPEISFGIFTEPMPRFIGNQVAQISVMQMFPWIGTLGIAKSEASLMAKAKYEQFNELKSSINYEIKTTWYALYLIEREIEITKENIEILKTLEQIVINRYTTGTAGEENTGSGISMSSDGSSRSGGSSGSMDNMNSQSASQVKARTQGSMNQNMGEMKSGSSMIDVLRVQLEINELNNSLILMYNNMHHLILQFNKLLNQDLNANVVIPDTLLPLDLPIPIFQIPDSIRENNPMINMLLWEEEAYSEQERMNRKMGFPMFGLGLQYEIFQPRPDNEIMMNGRNMLMPMITVSVPLWRNKYSSSIREAGYLRERIKNQKIDVTNELMVGFDEAIIDFQDAYRRIELYQKQLNLSQQALNILTVQYSTSGSDFEEVLRMQQQQLTYRLSVLEAIVDRNVTVAMLERLMGR